MPQPVVPLHYPHRNANAPTPAPPLLNPKSPLTTTFHLTCMTICAQCWLLDLRKQLPRRTMEKLNRYADIIDTLNARLEKFAEQHCTQEVQIDELQGKLGAAMQQVATCKKAQEDTNARLEKANYDAQLRPR